MTLYDTLIAKLKTHSNFVTDAGELKKRVVLNRAQDCDAMLINILLQHEVLKTEFFVSVKDVLVFNQNRFIYFLEQKNYLKDSYTRYKNKVGLTIVEQYLKQRNEVELVWPFKDCVLEGGQSNNEQAREEIFFNETLAQDRITQLRELKVFTNYIRYPESGATSLEVSKDLVSPPPTTKVGSACQSFNRNKGGTITDNLIIKGNNLLALYSLKQQFANKVKLIYIDPPYNTGNDSFKYNDRFKHSTWLTFMKNRLEVARELLAEDGVIFVQCDDNEQAYLKVLMDEIFGRDNFVNNIIWQKKFSPQNDAKWFSDNHDFILCYAKEKQQWRPNLLARTEAQNQRYQNRDNDPRGVWSSSGLDVKTYLKEYDYPITTPSGRVVYPPKGRCWRCSKDKFAELVKGNRIYFGNSGNNVPRIKRFLSEVKQGITPLTIWLHEDVGHNQSATQELKKVITSDQFQTPKPEKLLQRIIEIATQPGDIVLDYHLGSGTTAAVAHKMGRQYIGIEQMDYIETFTVERLKKVICTKDWDKGGISKAVNWQGGGAFIYFELKKYNEIFITKIVNAKNTDALLQVWEEMKEKSFLNYNVDLKKHDAAEADFKQLALNQQKQHLFELLDKNQLYVNLSSLADQDFKCTDAEKQVT